MFNDSTNSNGGFKIKPRIIFDEKNDNLRNYLKHKNENPNEPLPTDLLVSNFNLKPLFKNQEHINLIKDAMFSSSNEPGGTSYRHRLENPKYTFAGKTGSSQIKRFTEAQREAEVKQESLPYKDRDHALFVALHLIKIHNMLLVSWLNTAVLEVKLQHQ